MHQERAVLGKRYLGGMLEQCGLDRQLIHPQCDFQAAIKQHDRNPDFGQRIGIYDPKRFRFDKWVAIREGAMQTENEIGDVAHQGQRGRAERRGVHGVRPE